MLQERASRLPEEKADRDTVEHDSMGPVPELFCTRRYSNCGQYITGIEAPEVKRVQNSYVAVCQTRPQDGAYGVRSNTIWASWALQNNTIDVVFIPTIIYLMVFVVEEPTSALHFIVVLATGNFA